MLFSGTSHRFVVEKIDLCKGMRLHLPSVAKIHLLAGLRTKNLYQTLQKDDVADRPGKDTVYRFLNSSRYNWRRFLLLLGCGLIESKLNPLTDEDRKRCWLLMMRFSRVPEVKQWSCWRKSMITRPANMFAGSVCWLWVGPTATRLFRCAFLYWAQRRKAIAIPRWTRTSTIVRLVFAVAKKVYWSHPKPC